MHEVLQLFFNLLGVLRFVGKHRQQSLAADLQYETSLKSKPGDAASNAWVSSEQPTSFSCMGDTVWVRLESTDRQVSSAVRWAARCFLGCNDASIRHWKSGWLTKVRCLSDVKQDVACRLLTIIYYVSNVHFVPLLLRAMISLQLPNEDTGARPSAFLLHNIGQESESKDSKRRR